jgi:hypothetical protein
MGFAAPLCAAGRITVWTLTAEKPTSSGLFEPLTQIAPDLVVNDVELTVATRRAQELGLAHLVAMGSSEHAHDPPAFRQLVTPSAVLVEAVFIADLEADLHPAGPTCFESYELLPDEILLTPDVSLPMPEGSLIALYGRRSQPTICGEERIVVRCDSQEATGKNSATYPLATA